MRIPRIVVVLFCTLPWAAAVLGVGILAYLRFPPSGIFHIDSAADGKSPWVFPFLPSERVSQPGLQPEGWMGQRITADPVYATARIPGPYQFVDVTMEYRVTRQPLLEFGVTQQADVNSATMMPMYSSELDAPGWRFVQNGLQSGFVRGDASSTALNSTDPTGMALWDATATMPLLSDGAQEATSTEISLRGSHDFYLVPAGGKIQAAFTYQIANRKEGTDVVSFRVLRGEDEIADQAYTVRLDNEQQMGALQKHAINIANAAPGVYRISVYAPDDVFIRTIDTTSRHWVVGPRLYAGDTVGYLKTRQPLNVWTSSRHLVAETFHTEGLQTITFGSLSAKLQQTHATLRMDRTDASSLVELSAPQGDVRYVLDGYVAFRKDAFFEPRPRRFTDATQVNPEHIQVVLTSYQPPEHLPDGWLRSTFMVPLQANADTLRMTLSAPGLMSRAGSVDIRRIELTYHRPAGSWNDWMMTLRQELANAWHRL